MAGKSLQHTSCKPMILWFTYHSSSRHFQINHLPSAVSTMTYSHDCSIECAATTRQNMRLWLVLVTGCRALTSVSWSVWKRSEVMLVKRKYMPILLYGLECYRLLKADIRSLDFVVTRFVIKLFKSMNTDTINDCRIYFNFLMLVNW